MNINKTEPKNTKAPKLPGRTIHLRHLIIGSSLVLSACDSADEFEIAQPEPNQHASADEVTTASASERSYEDGLDPDCVQVLASIIMRVDLCLSRSCTRVALSATQVASSTSDRPPATAGSRRA